MFTTPIQMPAADRARWLAELSEVLGQAHAMLQRMHIPDAQRATAKELHLRIEAAKLEVQSLRLSRSLQPRPESDPEWMQPAPWLAPQARRA